MSAHIFVVEDEKPIQTLLRYNLEKEGFKVSSSENGEEALSLMVTGFCKEVFNELPLEFASEADRLLSLKLEGCVG